VSFSEQPPSQQWAALTFRGEHIADVWFKPGGDPLSLVFRIPQNSFQLPGIGQRLTTENLLKTVGIASDEVESWHHRGATDSARDGGNPELANPLPQPPPDEIELEIHVRLRPSLEAAAEAASSAPTAAPEWSDLEVRWKTLLGLEAGLAALRTSVESVRAELEASLRRTLSADEKTYAPAADVLQWNKVKSRVQFAIPKATEFIHRATWSAGTPERKRLGELFKDQTGTQTSLTQVDEELDSLRKTIQVMSAHGQTVYQECKAIAADVQSALRQVQSNAKARASEKKDAMKGKGL